MTLIKSISGIRGTIGGKRSENLTPLDIVECTAGFGHWILSHNKAKKVVIGRDGRISGKQMSELVIQTLLFMGIDVIDLGLSTTPTVEFAVPQEEAGAGIILTASHNPAEWNALKFLNDKGEFISAEDGNNIIQFIEGDVIEFAPVDQLGQLYQIDDYIERHVQDILNLELVDLDSIKNRKFHVVVDCINSTGALAIPALLKELGCSYKLINDEITGVFAHNPEPLPKHLSQLSEMVIQENADFGISVDPDVDRLAFVNEDGSMFGEEYTLVAVADYVLSKTKGATVSNLSSTRALRDVTESHECEYFASAVGEVNVVNLMKEKNAVIGGEGNGGVIYPESHYGRDAMVGIALLLSHLANKKISLSKLRNSFPSYEIRKHKIDLSADLNLEAIFDKLKKHYAGTPMSEIDGLKIDFPKAWVHLRKSNTEPIVRMYAEASTAQAADDLIIEVKQVIENN